MSDAPEPAPAAPAEQAGAPTAAAHIAGATAAAQTSPTSSTSPTLSAPPSSGAAKPPRAPFTTQDVENYAASYNDLAIWLSRAGDLQQIRKHMETVGVADRVLPGPDPAPADWSDSYYRTVCNDPDIAELLRLGVIETGYHNAVARFGAEAPSYGRAAVAKNLVRRPQLPLETLWQCVSIDRTLKAHSPLISLAAETTRFSAMPRPILLPLLRAIEKGEGFQTGKDVAVIVPWLETGGAELGAYWFYRGAEALGFSPVLILTETASVTPFFASQNLSIINLPDIFTRQLGNDYQHIPIEMKKLALKAVLDSLDVSIVHLVHSWVGYNLLGDPELTRELTANPKFLVSAFCPHIHTDGKSDGYHRHIPAIDRATAAYLCDSAWYTHEIGDMYGIEPTRTEVVRFPTTLAPARVEKPGASGPQRVLWASRLDYQKNPNVVFDIARRLPEVQFDVFGRQVLSDVQVNWDKAPPNVTYRGEFFAFGKLPLQDYKVFLYTSLFDGMPNILLEAASHGMPIISSPVGGIPEFLADGAGLMVRDAHDVDGYVACIRELLGDRDKRDRMVAECRRRIEEERSFETFTRVLAGVPLYRELLSGASPDGKTGAAPRAGRSSGGKPGLVHAA